jgi:hypothetical protein
MCVLPDESETTKGDYMFTKNLMYIKLKDEIFKEPTEGYHPKLERYGRLAYPLNFKDKKFKVINEFFDPLYGSMVNLLDEDEKMWMFVKDDCIPWE